MDKDVAALVALLEPLEHYSNALSVLSWDQEVTMPKGAAQSRAEMMSFLATKSHSEFVDPKIGLLLKKLAKKKLNPLEAAVVRETKHSYERATKVPASLIKEMSAFEPLATMAWREAKEKNDFSLFAPHLERGIKLLLQYCKAIDPKKKPYDVLLEGYDEELTTETVKMHLDAVKKTIVPLIKQIQAKKQRTTSLEIAVPQEKQHAFCTQLCLELGLPKNLSRLDISTHPMSWWLGQDTRITTRYGEGMWEPISATAHETGHSLYELGVNRALPNPLNSTMGMTVHESQSRLWENHVLKSKKYLEYFTPKLNKAYATTFTAETLYAAVNKVSVGVNRVVSDELTYNLHIILRFEIELELLSGKLKVKDIPKAWNVKMQEFFGITPKTDSEGCLQDVHWSGLSFAYFPQYVLGSMLSAQLMVAAKKAIPTLEKDLSKGDTKKLLLWLRENVHKHGCRYTTNELIKKATGKALSADDYLSYFKEKYGSLYKLN